MNFFHVMDFLSIQPILLVNGNRRLKTGLGTTLSILSMAVSLVVFGLFLDPFINRKNPNVVYSTYYEKYNTISIKKTDYPFAVSLWNSKGQTIKENERVYGVKAVMIRNIFENMDGTTKVKVENTFYPMKKCNEESFGRNWGIFNNSRWKDLYCLDYDNIAPEELILLNPKANGYDFSQFRILFHTCVNSTENNNNCLPQSEIDKALKSYMLHVETLDYYIDNNSVENPLVPVKLSSNYLSNMLNYKIVQYNLKNIFYKDDQGIIFSSFNNNNYTSLFKHDEYAGFISDVYFPGQIANFDLAINNRAFHDLIMRKYMKIQTIIADAGGFIKILILISRFIAYLFTRVEYNNILIQEMFNEVKLGILEDDKEPKSETDPKLVSKFAKNECNSSKVNLKLVTDNYKIQPVQTKSKLEKKTTMLDNYKYNYSVRNVFFFKCYKNETKIEIFLKSCLNCLDVRNLVKITNEVEYIKKHCNFIMPVPKPSESVMNVINKSKEILFKNSSVRVKVPNNRNNNDNIK